MTAHDLEENIFRNACSACEAGGDPGRVIDDGIISAPDEFSDEVLSAARNRIFNRLIACIRDWPSRIAREASCSFRRIQQTEEASQ